MAALDIKTIVYFAVMLNILTFIVMLLLWVQNHRRFGGISFWVADYFLQFLSIVLLYLRGNVPDWLSVALSNILILVGVVLLMIGLQRFVGKSYPMLPSYLLLAVLVVLQIYASLIHSDLMLRNYVVNTGIILFTGQSAWILLKGLPPDQRRVTMGPSVVLGILSLVTLLRLIFITIYPDSTNDFFKIDSADAIFYILQQILIIFVTFNLVLMVNQRLTLEVSKSSEKLRVSEEKFAKAFHSNPESIVITSLEKGIILEVNEAFTKNTGYAADEVLGRSALDLGLWVNETDRARLVENIAGSGKVINQEGSFRTRTGEIRTRLLSVEQIEIGREKCLIWISVDITEMAQAEKALKISEERFRLTLENLFEGGQIIGFDWRYIFVNRAAVWQSQHTREQLLGRTMMEVYPGIQNTPLFAALEKCMSQRVFDRVESEFVYESGERRWFDVQIQPVEEGLFVLTLDITESKNAGDALRQSEDRLRLILDSAAEAIYGLDPHGLCTFCNPACLRMLGYSSPDELLGKNMHDLIHYKHPDGSLYSNDECPIYQSFSRGSGNHVDSEVYWKKNGESFPVEYWSYPQMRDGQPVGSVVTFIDATLRKQAETRAIEMETLKQLNKAKSELLANVSHELRTPLASIKGFIETLLEPDVEWDKNDRDDFLRSADNEVDRLTFLIRDLLDMSRLDSGKLVLDMKTVRIEDILGTSLNVLASLASKHQLVYDIEPDLPAVRADKNRIGQVITNLVENAVKFSSEGTMITISVKKEPGRLVFSVEDQGEGMSREVMAGLFNRFYQAERVVSGKTRGTGLGLAICKGIIEAHGGQIRVASQPGQGSIFSFNLPLEPAQPAKED